MKDADHNMVSQIPADEIERVAQMGALLAKHRVELYAYLFAAVLDHHDAEDLVQDVSVVAIRSWRQYVPGTNCIAWLREIARRRVLEHFRKRDRRGLVLVDPEMLESLSAAMQRLEESATIDRRQQALRKCMERLEGAARQVMHDRYADRLSVEIIARRVSRTVQATYALLKRAKSLLRRCADEYLTHPERMETT